MMGHIIDQRDPDGEKVFAIYSDVADALNKHGGISREAELVLCDFLANFVCSMIKHRGRGAGEAKKREIFDHIDGLVAANIKGGRVGRGLIV